MQEIASLLFCVQSRLIDAVVWQLSFCGFTSHLIGSETKNIPDLRSGVLGLTGKTVTEKIMKSCTFNFCQSFPHVKLLKFKPVDTLKIPKVVQVTLLCYMWSVDWPLHHFSSSSSIPVILSWIVTASHVWRGNIKDSLIKQDSKLQGWVVQSPIQLTQG